MATAYDQIGTGYTLTRREDPRIAAMIEDALDDWRSVVNVGAGAGSYEPKARIVVAVEPSIEMIRQRPDGSAPVVLARAESLPFRGGSFDAALAILTIHHWTSMTAGLSELRRVARHSIVILTCDPSCSDKFWLASRYLPEIIDADRRCLPPITQLAQFFDDAQVREVPIPHDCQDGFQGAFWARPEAYLDPNVRRGISTFAKIAPDAVDRGLARLADDLHSGRWDKLFGHLRRQDRIDLGYRLIVAKPGAWSQSSP